MDQKDYGRVNQVVFFCLELTNSRFYLRLKPTDITIYNNIHNTLD